MYLALGNSRPTTLVKLENCVLQAVLDICSGNATKPTIDTLYISVERLLKDLRNDDQALNWFNISSPALSAPLTPLHRPHPGKSIPPHSIVHLITLRMIGGLISPPQSCYNSPSVSLTSISTSSFPPLTPAPSGSADSSMESPLGPSSSRTHSPEPKLSLSKQQSVDEVDQREETVVAESEGDSKASPNRQAGDTSPRASSSLELPEAESSSKEQSGQAVDQQEETFLPQTELAPSREQTAHEVHEREHDIRREDVGGCQGSGDGDLMARSRRSSVSSALSAAPALSDHEDDDPMVSVEQKSRADLSQEEEAREEDEGASEPMDVDAEDPDSSRCLGNPTPESSHSSDDAASEPMQVDAEDSDLSKQVAPLQLRRSLRNADLRNNATPESSDSSDDSASEPMDVDADSDLSVKQVAPLQLRRSLRNACIHNKPSPELVPARTVIHPRRQPTRKIVLLDVRVENS
jgi:hypothetical protein